MSVSKPLAHFVWQLIPRKRIVLQRLNSCSIENDFVARQWNANNIKLGVRSRQLLSLKIPCVLYLLRQRISDCLPMAIASLPVIPEREQTQRATPYAPQIISTSDIATKSHRISFNSLVIIIFSGLRVGFVNICCKCGCILKNFF